MPNLRETILTALHARLLVLPATALRGDVLPERIPVLPSTYKCPQSGAALPVENPLVWVYQPEETS